MNRVVYLKRLVIDLILISISFFVAYYLLHSSGESLSRRTFILFIYTISFWYFASQTSFLYNEFLSRSLSQEIIAVVKTIILQDFFIIVALFFGSRNVVASKWFMVTYLAMQFLLLPLSKYFTRWYFGYLFKKNQKLIKLLVIGAGELGMNFNNLISNNYQSGYAIAGFLDDAPKPFLNGQYLGKIESLEQILQQNDVQEVIVALPNNATERIKYVVDISEAYAKRVRIIPDYYKLSASVAISSFGSLPLISIRSIPLDNTELRYFKRVFDVVFSFLTFVFVFSWLFPIIALLIKINSKGPVFYIQERWGINGKKISCYKFRSMYKKVNNEICDSGKFRPTEKNDPRVTSIGKFLRKHNIDELPQFINVLKGEMSIIGPRPHASLQNEEMRLLINNYMVRHLVKPGITGWAQINGFRGETKQLYLMQKRVDFDIWYIENWSFWLDCQIIVQTIINMIKGDKNAY
jgi:putative colanic acid biosynthesis UDP-glucose lipid carrier transferase